ncbi:hypothetical protein FNV43_RR15982 [Rhamnella rubrinervis]|uniref:THO1-MOS11 C-terminal domain-containing protein n=1 Tax=Rhamnella rubrinervis TaxID=2594499 RepID=A0A8K0E8G1_9ROSA|nr:hypothetical protein FNV43_RR15982 [Rhamnella rubrinervis]
MATSATKPSDTNPSVENPKQTLDPVAPTAAKTDRPQDPKADSFSAPPSSSDVAVSGTNGSVKEGEDSKSAESVVEAVGADAAADPVSDIQKKIRRAERFGISVQLTEKEKRNSRAERFGTGSTVGGSEVSKKTEELKRKARAERFGLPASVTPVASEEEAKKKARLARFAPVSKTDTLEEDKRKAGVGPVSKTDTLEEDKRKARAIRFSNTTPSSSLSQENGKGSIEPNAAIVGKAGGVA